MAVSCLINVSMRTLLVWTALLPAPCACAAAVRSSSAIFTTACCRSKRSLFRFFFMTAEPPIICTRGYGLDHTTWYYEYC